MDKHYYHYWGKAKKDQTDHHLLVYHSLDVAAVGQVLLERHDALRRRLSDSLNISEEMLQQYTAFFLSLHDIGKFSEAFQGLRQDLLKLLHQKEKPRPYTHRHDSLGYVLWKDKAFNKQLKQDGLYFRTSESWIQAVCGHHGEPPMLRDQKSNSPLEAKHYFSENDIEAAYQFVMEMSRLFLANTEPLQRKEFSEQLRNISWWIAGFCVLCDWIGSGNDEYCQHPDDLNEYWQKALKNAEKAVSQSGVIPARKIPYSGIRNLFRHVEIPSPLQKFCDQQEISAQPQLWILEDVTGSGKTEAALILAHRLMSLNQGDGVFIGLPTMATANGMYDRMVEHYRKLYADDQKPSLILAHSARHLSEKFSQSILPHAGQNQDYKDESSASSQCSAWIADHRKKSMLADVGIGTIDQAMLGVLPVRHQSLRLLGLMSKILIIDEIHAYDDYMRPIICALIMFHTRIGGSVILLSATLPENIRAELVKAYRNGLGNYDDFILEKKESYPLVTWACGNEIEEFPIETRKELERSVTVRLIHDENSVYDIILKAAESGQCVCWIRNTVTDARESFRHLREMNADKLSLFHARFTLSDRLKIEESVKDNFGKDSGYQKRHGKILIATQVVEQSLDLDFDLLISDLAPIDLMIQRAGRLHRHVRNYRKYDPVMYVLSPEPAPDPAENWFGSFFPKAKKIYPHVGQLWLTARLLSEKGCIRTPDGARNLIEGVYGNDAEAIPEKLLESSWTAEGEQKGKKSMGTRNALEVDKGYSRQDALWDEDADFPTRLGEDTVTVYLADEQLNPLFKGEHSWDLSSVKIYKSHLSDISSNIPKSLKTKLNHLRETEKWLQYGSVVLPMTQISENEWRADGVDGKGREVRVVYHSELGLFTEK